MLPKWSPSRTELPQRATKETFVVDDDTVDAEWHSLVDSEMSKSPHAAHLQMREDRRFAQLQRAWEKDQLLEMQRKLERYQRNAPEYERTEPVITSSGGLRQPRPKVVPFSQRRQQEILEEFQRQKEVQMEKEEQAEKARLQQLRQKMKEERRQQRRESRAREAAAPEVLRGTDATQSRSVLATVTLLFQSLPGISRLLSRRCRVSASAASLPAREGATAINVDLIKPSSDETVEGQVEVLIRQVEDSLAQNQGQPLALRRKIFREWQRKLHPDKNSGSSSFNLAFQHLMARQREYLRS